MRILNIIKKNKLTAFKQSMNKMYRYIMFSRRIHTENVYFCEVQELIVGNGNQKSG